jgi:peroxiredoxin
VRALLVLVVALIACRPAPVLNPNKDTKALKAESAVQRENELSVAPGGTVHGPNGSTIDLATLWEKQPVVVVFYRGHWCPHCQRQLGELEKRRAELTALGATLVAISSDTPADAAATKTKLGLGFELYSDTELAVITKWGVEDFGQGIARPATFIVEPGGAITFRKIGEKPEDRPSSQQILDALAAR